MKNLLALFTSRSFGARLLTKIPPPVLRSFSSKVSLEQLLEAITIQPQSKTDTIEISCIARNPQASAAITNLAVDTLIEENNRSAESSQNLLVNWLKNEVPRLEQKNIEKPRDNAQI